MDIKNLPRARTTIDIVWAHFWCDPARFSSMVILRRVGGHGGSGREVRSTNTEIPITCRARVASQPAGSIAFTNYKQFLLPCAYIVTDQPNQGRPSWTHPQYQTFVKAAEPIYVQSLNVY
jgi:hypothetical protein